MTDIRGQFPRPRGASSQTMFRKTKWPRLGALGSVLVAPNANAAAVLLGLKFPEPSSTQKTGFASGCSPSSSDLLNAAEAPNTTLPTSETQALP